MNECPAGCCPHGGAFVGQGCPPDIPGAPTLERIIHLRTCRLLTVARIAALTGIDRQRVTRLLYDAATRSVDAGRRPARRAGQEGWLDAATAPPADHVGRARRTRTPSGRGAAETELLTDLYADPEVRRVLDKHGIPVVNLAEPAWKRFPTPQPLSPDLVSDLYEGCGLGLHHIGLLTGRPAAAAGAVLRAKGIRLRPAGGTSPFTRRRREGDRPGGA